jgi:bifunctional UDP-N-acetylglucosamine pyrophosphorylase/glucosamine-1-phosphate N-acetyltransferase
MPTPNVAGIILAAGLGTRMKSSLPKGLHRVCGVPMVEIIGRAMRKAGVAKPILVVGHGADAIRSALGDAYEYVVQEQQLGTGHAAMTAQPFLENHQGPVLVAFGDTPLVDETVFTRLLQDLDGAACSFSSAMMPDPTGYGRVVRSESGDIERIVEEKDCTPGQKAIQEVNAGVHCFDAEALLEAFPKLTPANAQGEYYLTDIIGHMAAAGRRVVATPFDESILLGVNDRWALALADRILRERTAKRWAFEGVTIVDPVTTHIGLDVTIGRDTVLLPGTMLEGETHIGEGCEIGPYTRIRSTTVGDGTKIAMSLVKDSTIGSDVYVGPFAHIRAGADVRDGCKIGDFVEIKNSLLGSGVKASHLTYLGDAEIGEETNIGAGTITCNYDGFQKNRTTVGRDCFIGSHSTLVAPVTVGDGAMTAAGSVVTQSVPPDALALGRSRQENKEAWVSEWRRRKASRRAD